MVRAFLLFALPASVPTAARADCTGKSKVVRRAVAGSGFVAANAYMYRYFKQAWWSGEKAPHWFVKNDWDLYFRDQDKLGHFLGGYQLARISSDLVHASCVSSRKSAYIGAAYAGLFQLQIEIWDGYRSKYGFSPADLIANTTGAGLALSQELFPALRAVRPTMSYHESGAQQHVNDFHGDVHRSADYSGQTYWLSFDMHEMLPGAAGEHWPRLARFSFGHSITDSVDPVTGAPIRAKRKLLLSVDFNPEALPGNNRIWRRVKHEIAAVRFPAPALEITPRVHFDKWYR